jgi:plasmid replication initiation protein
MEKDYLVTKSNFFIMNSNYDLSLEEQKIILTLASMVQPIDEEFKPYYFKISDFMKLLEINTKTKYTEIPRITKELMKKVFEIEYGKKILQVAWLSSAEYEKGSGIIELQFSPKLKPFMLGLKKFYTSYKLANILNMKSKYSPRIYEILKCNEFKKQGYVEITVSSLRKLLKAEKIYPLYADFKRKIIIRTQKELKKLSDIYFDFEEIKTGRKVTSIKFYMHDNKHKNEIAADTKIKTIEPSKIQNQNTTDIDKIKIVKSIIKENIKDSEAQSIFNAANGDIQKIKEKYNLISNFDLVKNVVGAMIRALKEDWKITSKRKVSTFTNYKQRTYDYDDLERKLLGWDKEKN